MNIRLAFVIRFGNGTRPAEGLFEGRVEEVDSCTERRFRSAEELLKFLGQRSELAMAAAQEAEVNNSDEQGARSERASASTLGYSSVDAVQDGVRVFCGQ